MCNQPLGAGDYLALAKQFRVLIVSRIPQLGKDNNDAAKRFITLVDALYEHKVKLICSAEVEPGKLYVEGHGVFEFERAVSRLLEMQSSDYFKLQHIAC